jgi:hypothetical protein
MNKRRFKKIDAYTDYWLLPSPIRAYTKAPIIGHRDRNIAITSARKVKHAMAYAIQKSPLGELFRGVPMLTDIFNEMFLEECL